MDNEIVLKLNDNCNIKTIYNDLIIFYENYNDQEMNLKNVKTNEEVLIGQFIGVYNGVLLAYKGNNVLVYDNEFKYYDNLDGNINPNGFKISSNTETIYIDTNKGKISEQDFYKVKINDKYYIDYADNSKLKRINDDVAISDVSFMNFEKSPVNDNFVVLYEDSTKVSYILINDELKKCKNIYSGKFYDEYFVGHEEEQSNSIIYIDSKGNINKSDCIYSLNYIGKDYSYCESFFYTQFIKDNKILDKKYEKISCNDYGYCRVVNKNESKSALYYYDEQIIEPYYDSIEFSNNCIILNRFDTADILFISKDGEPIKIDKKPTTEEYNVDVEKIIKDNDLSKYQQIINDNIELFKKYSYVLENNKKLGKYKKNMYDYFKVVADQKEYLNEKDFFEALSNLSFEVVDNLLNVLGMYNHSEIKITLIESSKNDNDVINHEIMHFIDYNLNDNTYKRIAKYDDKYITEEEYEKLSREEKIEINNKLCYQDQNIRLFVEGGAENNTAYYFRKNIISTYELPVAVYRMFEYLIGKDNMDKVFYNNENLFSFINKYVDIKQYQEFVNEYNTKESMPNLEIDKHFYKSLIDIIITIYKNKFSDDWMNNNEFKFMLYNILISNTFEDFSDSDYYEDLILVKNQYDTAIEDVLLDKVQKISPKYTLSELNMLLNYENGKFYVYFSENTGYLKVEYDVNTRNYKIIEFISSKNN